MNFSKHELFRDDCYLVDPLRLIYPAGLKASSAQALARTEIADRLSAG